MKMIGFFPYSPYGVDYIVTMQRLIQTEHSVVDYLHLKYGLYDVDDISCIYLNWIEDTMDARDVELLTEAKKKGTRIIWVFHNKLSHDRHDDELTISNITRLVSLSDKVVLHSKDSGAVLAEICKRSLYNIEEKLVYIPHPNYINDYKSYVYPNKKQVESKNDKLFTFGFVGQMRPYKNIEVLIEAYKGVRDGNTRLILAGGFTSNDYYDNIKQMCAGFNDIEFVPYYIGALEMEAVLEKMDILVLPYNLECTLNSGSMIMAFSYKKPVIVSDICMAKDYRDDLIFKYHYKNENEHTGVLKEKMREALELGRSQLILMGKELYKIVERDNAPELIRERLMKIIEG